MTTHRDILKKALNHESGQIPVDFGSTAITGMHVSCIPEIRKHLGLKEELVKVHDPYQMLGFMEDDLLDALGIDVAGVSSPFTMFGYENKNWHQWRTPWGQEVLVGDQFQTDEDDNGIVIYPEGDRTAPPSGRMPKSGYFFDTIIRQNNSDPNKMNFEDNLEEFGPISDKVFDSMRQQIEHAQKTKRGVVANITGTAFGDIAIVPAPFLKYPKGVRDITNWYMATVAEPDYVLKVFTRQLEIALENLKKIDQQFGDSIDVVNLCGTDFGTQVSAFFSQKTFRKLWFPFYKELNDWIHANTSWKTFKHSCGAIFDLLPLFIECGFDIMNPVQCSAKGMEPQALKEKFGDSLVFWGGGVDTQKLLPFGSPAEVREQVLGRCEIFSQNGGFVFNAIHNVQSRTPVENIIAMFDAVASFNQTNKK